MGKKTVPIASQIIPRKKVLIRIKPVIGVLTVAGNFKIIHEINR
jgi:hypothetical protein